ncbi:MAG: permease prefix domain 1-containing protein [Candidatus Acidiferrales bacterium]
MTRRDRMLDGLDQEILDHIERETQDNIARGMSPDEARYAALRKFGNVMRVKEDTRAVWRLVRLEQLWHALDWSPACSVPGGRPASIQWWRCDTSSERAAIVFFSKP